MPELPAALTGTVADLWSDSVLPSLSELVRIPALSPAFDPDWADHGHLDAAAAHVEKWIAGRGLPGATTEVIRLPGRTPLLLVDVPATPGAEAAGTVLLYGHLDKQPPMDGWAEGLGPWTPIVRDGRLYGRGASDDGYSGYAATTALRRCTRTAARTGGRCWSWRRPRSRVARISRPTSTTSASASAR